LLAMMGQSSAAQEMLAEMSSLEAATWPAWLRSERLSLQGWIYHAQQRFEEALAVNSEQQALLQLAPEETRALVRCQSSLCLDLNMMRRFDESMALARAAIARERNAPSGSAAFLWARLVYALAFAGRIEDAWATMREALPVCRRDGALLWAGGLLAVLLAERGAFADATRVDAAGMAYARRAQMEELPTVQRTHARFEALLAAAACAPEDIQRWQREGVGLDEAAIAAIGVREGEPLAT
jgi:tetratricopeptide (TPR) repeat protein